MITASEIYWILKLDAIQNVFLAFSMLTGVFGIVMAIAWGVMNSSPDDCFDSEKKAASCRKRFFITVPIFALLAAVTALTPSTKQMAAIKIIPAIANSEIVGELSADAKELYRMGINAIKEQLTGNNKEQSKEGVEK
jgi:hypothetical protein